jgi:DNA-binding response OmpR family regulator
MVDRTKTGLGPVLQVEDEETDVFFLEKAFAKAEAGTTLVSVSDGQDGIAYLKGDGIYADRQNYPEPCLLLLDLNLPRVSGFEVLEWIQQQPQWRDSLPVIVLTSSGQESDRRRAFELGAHEYLIKPSQFEQLVTLVKDLKRRWLDPVAGSRLAPSPAIGVECK